MDNVSSINLSNYLYQVNINYDVHYETFTLILFNIILLVDGETIIDLSLIIGNHVDTFLSGITVDFTLFISVSRLVLLIFYSLLLLNFISQNQFILILFCLLEFISILFRALTLPNRLSVNLFSGSLLINIFILGVIDHSLIQLVYFYLNLLLFYEVNNAILQLFIFSLLTMTYLYNY